MSEKNQSGKPQQRVRIGDKNTALERYRQRVEKTSDAAREQRLSKRRAAGVNTARENIERLCDNGSFKEYGQFAVAAQRSRKPLDELIEKTSGDGVLTGLAEINAELFGSERAQAAVVVNDYSVLAATQGFFHHRKLDRMINVASAQQLPMVMYTEGGGGRPGDTDVLVLVAGLDVKSFTEWASLPTAKIAVNRGYCFAGNALLFGSADFRIATRDSNIGMAGPAMIEGGGLGSFSPEEIGPAAEHFQNGDIDFLVDDEDAAAKTARQLLSYFQGDLTNWSCPDQSELWQVLPDDRRYSYDARKLINALADHDSFLEYGAGFGLAVVTGFIRIEGKPYAVLANDTRQFGGALNAEASEKMARFVEICERLQIGIVSLCDTPGFMVGPDSEKEGALGANARLFRAGATATVPNVCIAIRKAYGLGAMAMALGDFSKPVLTAAWPTGEFGGMGLEGAVHLGFKKELDAISDPAEKQALFDTLLAELYERGKATEMASFLEIDAVIEPADTRKMIIAAMQAAGF